jgi:hypothetical protein
MKIVQNEKHEHFSKEKQAIAADQDKQLKKNNINFSIRKS